MSKKKNILTFNPNTRTLVVNGKDWGNLGLDAWVLERLANKSNLHNGLDFVVTDQPIKYGLWQNFHALEMYPDISTEVAKKVLHEHNYRGGFHNHHFALTASTKYGTDVPLITDLPKDIGDDALVFFYAYNHSTPADEFCWTIVHQM